MLFFPIDMHVTPVPGDPRQIVVRMSGIEIDAETYAEMLRPILESAFGAVEDSPSLLGDDRRPEDSE